MARTTDLSPSPAPAGERGPARAPHSPDRALERVARALGERDGTGPDHTRWRHRAREVARREALEAGRREVLRAILAGRGMSEIEPVLAEAADAELPLATVLAALEESRDAADLRARLRGAARARRARSRPERS